VQQVMATKYKIHPAIGIARVGNSAEYYLAPETPGGLPLDPASNQPIYTGPGVPPQSVFRDQAGALKKQAARFKVYAYDDANPDDPGTPVGAGSQIDGKTVTAIEWTVYLASKKASWFQFRQLTGSGMEGDGGYDANNAANPGGTNSNLPYNPLRVNEQLGTSADPTTIDDTKRLALIFDPGPKTVSGAKVPAEEFAIAPKGLQPFEITTLGRILTDGDGNLIVLGGEGNSGTTAGTPHSIRNYANNPGWFDDVSDGPVSGSLVLDDGGKVPIDLPAWVLCGPPAYAPEVSNAVSLYDTMYDVFVRELGLNPSLYGNGQFQASYRPHRDGEIDPLLLRPNLYRYVAAISGFGVSSHEAVETETHQSFAATALPAIRSPDKKNVAGGLMPKLAGDNPLSPGFQPSNYLTLTATQFFILCQYAKGDFDSGATPFPGEGPALDRASLENCVGGAFCPGIEMTWVSRNPTLYVPLPATPTLSDAFRFRHKDVSGGLTLSNGSDNDYSAGLEPGDATKYMAQPWQADFNECSVQPIAGTRYWWWPAQRPYSVFPVADQSQPLQWTRQSDTDSSEFPDLQMVTNWKDLGFILNVGAAGSPQYLEIERDQKAISDYPPPASAVAEATPLKGPNAKPD